MKFIKVKTLYILKSINTFISYTVDYNKLQMAKFNNNNKPNHHQKNKHHQKNQARPVKE